MRLGIVQAARKGHSAAAATYREVIALLDEEDDNFTSTANSCAWQLYMACDNLDEAAKLAHRAWQKTPADTNILQTLAAILVRHNQWSEALVHIRDWVGRVDRTDLSSAWNQHVLLFRDALTHGQGENLAGILNGELWEPMRIALVKSSRSDHDLSDVPTGLREAVTALLSQLRGENVPLVYPSFEFGSVLPTG